MKCRHCGMPVSVSFAELGSAPPSNSYLSEKKLVGPEKWYPLSVMVCDKCWLVQTNDFVDAEEMFTADYAYFSSFSDTWLSHVDKYVGEVVSRFDLTNTSLVAEVAANDGYLLQYVKQKDIPCYGIEPSASTAEKAREKGIEIIGEFFGVELANKLVGVGKSADLLIANNVLAHVPDVNDFVSGFSVLLKEDGVATFEFPHLLNLVKYNQFDTIYHEHYSYLSLTVVDVIFNDNGLSIFDVEEVSTHGGSLRVYAQRKDVADKMVEDAVIDMLERVKREMFYAQFQSGVDAVKHDLIQFLLNAKRLQKSVIAYGAAAKGNTLLNYAGVRKDLLPYVVDRNPAKIGQYLPGSRIPILGVDILKESEPDYVLILPWNIKDEVSKQLEYIREWGGKFVTAIPKLEVL